MQIVEILAVWGIGVGKKPLRWHNINLMSAYICPHCKNPIYDEDVLSCHFCGESLNRAGKGFMSNLRYANNRVAWFFIVFAVLIAVVLLFVR